MVTKLLYMEDMQLLQCSAKVQKLDQQEGKTILYLDQTVFYPQGGGQPYDTGVITATDWKFAVEEVRYSDGEVLHIGHLEGSLPQEGDNVQCVVDKERRSLHTRLHSAGHVLDMAVHELGYGWKPGKGYHFPQGAYVEYEGSLEGEEKQAVIDKLNQQIQQILSRGIATEIRFMPKEEMAQYCRHVPEFLPAGKPSRIVLYGSFGVPCGGTHVANLNDIGVVRIRKIKTSTDTVRVSYEIS